MNICRIAHLLVGEGQNGTLGTNNNHSLDCNKNVMVESLKRVKGALLIFVQVLT